MNTTADIRFRVNGRQIDVSTKADTPLIYILRNDLNLKGTRFGCGEGHCGSCTVVIDGRAVQSCNTPVSFVAGKKVDTIESMVGDTPHPIVAAIESHKAWQCGYCLAGIIMQARALYDAGTRLNRQEIANSLDTHLCRCGAHPRILDALSEVLGDGESSA